MSDERIRTILQQADETARAPSYEPIDVAGIRRRARLRVFLRVAVPLTTAAALILTTTLIALRVRPAEPQPQRQMASLEERIKQLEAQTDATLKLVQEVLERDRQEQRLTALETELASIPDPMREIDRRVDETAFVLLYQADKLYKELNRTDSAVAAYKEVIQLFPKNRWAQVARERLSQIERRQFNKSDTKGEPTCEPEIV